MIRVQSLHRQRGPVTVRIMQRLNSIPWVFRYRVLWFVAEILRRLEQPLSDRHPLELFRHRTILKEALFTEIDPEAVVASFVPACPEGIPGELFAELLLEQLWP